VKRVYLDYAATTPVDPQVFEAMKPYFSDMYGNPSSVHSCGQEVRDAIELARGKVAGMIGADPSEIVFTSGGTEANNQALKGAAFTLKEKGNHIITSSLEHHSVSETCEYLEKAGCEVTVLPVDKFGMVDPSDVKKAITKKTILISIMHANNEIGTIQPIAEIARIAKAAGVYFHTDAVQTAGHLEIDVKKLDMDFLSMSAHKLYGPKGTGALYIKDGIQIESLLHGGAQEQSRRASTENVPGIVGFGKAAEMAAAEMKKEMAREIELRQKLIAGLQEKIKDTFLNGHPSERLPNNANLSIYGIEGEATLLNLDLESICVSTGSACSSGSMEPSHVLMAMKVPAEIARCSVRFSLGRWTTDAEIDRVLQVLPKVVGRLRAMSPLYK
jgi:cysteine desulfurase